ncbi:related to Protein involved in vacuole transport [Zygosaccharomyces bailii ISA1307]|nr:related to Protein involved in vacuole transport [Zygosaccharomyces bailii ISA1307]
MVVDDSTYITPHEAALAIVATSMKKARMQLDVLIVNTVMAGILFSCGSILTVAVHSENPDTWDRNPGTLDFVSGIFCGTGLFYVVILGADLYNSNILYFSVGFLRRSVTIYDLLISWLCSIIGNLGGCLLVSYVICHLSASSTSHLWKIGSRKLVEGKASFSFIQTLLKGIGGNFFVCLAIYLQLMAKPLHVKWLLTVLPIFTFTACGFTHVVADMTVSFIGMLNGADVSVGKYIWKLLIPAAVGNILGGFFFSFTIPFYLHLLVVDRDRKRLDLPLYEERDEQPELNMDSRVVRFQPDEERYDEEEAEEEEQLQEKDARGERLSDTYATYNTCVPTFSRSSSSGTSSFSERPQVFDGPIMGASLTRNNSSRSNWSYGSTRSHRHVRNARRTPTGVFPVKGMRISLPKGSESPSFVRDNLESPVQARGVHVKTTDMDIGGNDNTNNVFDQRPGARLEKAINQLVTRVPSRRGTKELPRTTQDVFPYNQPPLTYSSRRSSCDNPLRPSSISLAVGVEQRNDLGIPKAKTPSLQKSSGSHLLARSSQSLPQSIYRGDSNFTFNGSSGGNEQFPQLDETLSRG